MEPSTNGSLLFRANNLIPGGSQQGLSKTGRLNAPGKKSQAKPPFGKELVTSMASQQLNLSKDTITKENNPNSLNISGAGGELYGGSSKNRTFLEKENQSNNNSQLFKPIQNSQGPASASINKQTVFKKESQGKLMENTIINVPTDFDDLVESVRGLESLVSYQEAFLEDCLTELERLTIEKQQRETSILETRTKIDSIDNELKGMNAAYMNEINKLLNETTRHQDETKNMKQIHIVEETRHNALKLEIDEARRLIEKKQKEGEDLQKQIHLEESRVKEKQNYIEHVMKTLNHYNKVEEDLEQDIKEILEKKKVLNNELQELKGNIRVYLRVRPDNEHSIAPNPNHLLIHNYNALDVLVPSQFLKSENNIKEFKFGFDHIFDQSATQDDIFNELSQLVQSAMDGYNVCILAYGQTGSGKTYTMEGNFEDFSARGIIPRSVEFIFEQVGNIRKYGWDFKLYVNFREVYLEQVRDLLKNEVVGDNDLTLVEVEKPRDLYNLLRKAHENRKIAETFCNEHSSRSHLIFHLRIKGWNNSLRKETEGSLNLVDLAGSERLSQSKAEGERLKETKSINLSLTTLGDVITAIANKVNHVPYRNSKLTYLLQNFLGGDSKTLMLVTVSPLTHNFPLTLGSLRFAAKVKQCEQNYNGKNGQKKNVAGPAMVVGQTGSQTVNGSLNQAGPNNNHYGGNYSASQGPALTPFQSLPQNTNNGLPPNRQIINEAKPVPQPSQGVSHILSQPLPQQPHSQTMNIEVLGSTNPNITRMQQEPSQSNSNNPIGPSPNGTPRNNPQFQPMNIEIPSSAQGNCFPSQQKGPQAGTPRNQQIPQQSPYQQQATTFTQQTAMLIEQPMPEIIKTPHQQALPEPNQYNQTPRAQMVSNQHNVTPRGEPYPQNTPQVQQQQTFTPREQTPRQNNGYTPQQYNNGQQNGSPVEINVSPHSQVPINGNVNHHQQYSGQIPQRDQSPMMPPVQQQQPYFSRTEPRDHTQFYTPNQNAHRSQTPQNYHHQAYTPQDKSPNHQIQFSPREPQQQQYNQPVQISPRGQSPQMPLMTPNQVNKSRPITPQGSQPGGNNNNFTAPLMRQSSAGGNGGQMTQYNAPSPVNLSQTQPVTPRSQSHIIPQSGNGMYNHQGNLQQQQPQYQAQYTQKPQSLPHIHMQNATPQIAPNIQTPKSYPQYPKYEYQPE